MKIFFLIFTLFFSVSVLADCCNFEAETSVEQCSKIEKAHEDHCGDSSQHSEDAQHCHCSPINHFKIFSSSKISVAAPISIQNVPFPFSKSLLISKFESLIFHPPIA